MSFFKVLAEYLRKYFFASLVLRFILIVVIARLFGSNMFDNVHLFGDFLLDTYYLVLFSLVLIPVTDIPFLCYLFFKSRKSGELSDFVLASIQGVLAGILIIFITVVIDLIVGYIINPTFFPHTFTGS